MGSTKNDWIPWCTLHNSLMTVERKTISKETLKKLSIAEIKKLVQQRKFNEAQKLCQQLTHSQPNNLIGWYMLADLSLQIQDYVMALSAIHQAERIDDNQPQIKILKSRCFLCSGDPRQALTVALNLMKSKPTLLAKDWFSLGILLHRLNGFRESHHCFVEAASLNPDNSQIRYNLATSYRNQGQFAKAYDELTVTLKLNPKDWDAYLARSLLNKVTKEKNHLTEINQKIKENSSNTKALIKLHFSQAKELEDCQDFEASFRSLKTANDLRYQHSAYQVQQDVEAMKCLSQTFSQTFSQKNLIETKNTSKTFENNEAIFIVGLPRTGTTLLERIISNHPEVYSAGELHHFSNCITRLTASSSKQKINNKIDLIKASSKLDFSELGKCYVESTRPLTGHTEKFIDKLPLNFLNIGLIRKALPNAKIIHLTRTPMAACYAMYKTYFEQAYPFTYNLEQLARYYISYRKLMQHWCDLNPDNILEINYEQLVTDPENSGQKAFDFCDLSWSPNFLEINKNDSSIATASAAQARGKIYHSSINRWEKFSKHLQSLSQTLKNAGINPDKWS